MTTPEFDDPFARDFGAEVARNSPGIAIFIDRPQLREQLADDARAAGFAVVIAAPLDRLSERGVPGGVAVILIDCPAPDLRTLAALAVQDLAARDSGAQLIVATTLAGLEDVFACLDLSQPQLLVDPTAADLAIALGHAFARAGQGRLRDLAEEDRRRLIQLTEMVVRLVERLEGPARQLAPPAPASGRVENPAIRFRGPPDESAGLVRPGAPDLPSPVLVRQVLRCRQLRGRYFDAALFADPAWDMTPKIFEKSI